MNFAHEKKQLRLAMKHILASLSTESRLEQSQRVANHLGAWITSNTNIAKQGVAFFSSLPFELSTAPLDSVLLDLGLKRLIPLWSLKRPHLDFYVIPQSVSVLECAQIYSTTSLNTILKAPLPYSPVPPEEIGLLIVPALAFDCFGARLGRGMGYYDRYLSETRKKQLSMETIVIGFDEQLVSQVPIDIWDEKIDWIATSFKGIKRKKNK